MNGRPDDDSSRRAAQRDDVPRDADETSGDSLFSGVGVVCKTAARLTGADGAAAAVMTASSSRELVYATDALAQQIAELQFVIGEGPCMDAYVQTVIADLADRDDSRWPEYRRYATAAGMRGMRAFPVTSLTIPLGSLVVHTDEPWGVLRSNDFGQILANLTAIAMAGRSIDVRRDELAATIETILRGTVSIATATGILAECLGLDARQARLTLIRLAGTRNVTVTAYANSVIDAQRNNPHDPGAGGVFDPPPELAPPQHIDT